jgi:RimJ/RimL family protein N-acetyltransferase
MPAPLLETPRLLLRQWRDADVEEWVKMGSDPRVMEFFPSLEDRERADPCRAHDGCANGSNRMDMAGG